MTKIIGSEVSGKEQFNNERFKAVIKSFMESFYKKPEFRVKFNSEVDVSAPKTSDINAMQSGEGNITNLNLMPDFGQIHFYVGGTEIHLIGEAAKQIFKEAKVD